MRDHEVKEDGNRRLEHVEAVIRIADHREELQDGHGNCAPFLADGRVEARCFVLLRDGVEEGRIGIGVG